MKKKSKIKSPEDFGKKLEAIKHTAPTCVQCLEPMFYGTNWDKHVPICTNPKCPNYGLLQIGLEALEEIGEDK